MRINYTNLPVSKRLKVFTTATEKKIKMGKRPTIQSFSIELNEFKKELENQKHLDAQIKRISLFAERLVGYGLDDFAGTVYSFLLKLSPSQKITEEIARKELALAKRTKDPIHICARISDLEKIYKAKMPNSPEHIKWIRENTKYLRKLVNHYEHAKRNYRTMIKRARPKEYYERALANSNLNLAKVTMCQSPKEALKEVKEAQEILKRLITNKKSGIDTSFLEKDLQFAELLTKNINRILKQQHK